MLQALSSLTGIALNDQLLIFGGQKLEPSKTLGSHGLPQAAGLTAPGGDEDPPVGNNTNAKANHVFLYCKSLLRPDAPPPPQEPLEVIETEEVPPVPPSGGGSAPHDTHPLDNAPSPLIRALPEFERQFRHQRRLAAATWHATQARFEACRRLVMEMHVQALAIDSARHNVDLHFSYICRYQGEFSQSHAAQAAEHAALLASFESDMEALRSTPLHPAVVAASERRHQAAAVAAREAQQKAKQFAAAAAAGSFHGGACGVDAVTQVGTGDPPGVGSGGAGGGGGGGDAAAVGPSGMVPGAVRSGASTPASSTPTSPTRPGTGSAAVNVPAVPAVPPVRRHLLDCVPEERVRRWAADCRRSHEQFTAKVRDLGGLFAALQRTTEELFMTGPDVDIAALEGELERAQGRLAEQAAVIQCLDKDLETVGCLVEDAVADLAGAPMSASRVDPLSACAALDPMNELHVASHLPAVKAVDEEVVALHRHCAACKSAMAHCVHRQLQSISALQSKIRDMRNKQAAFKEVGQRQEAAFRELRIARRIPRVYRACLAEVARRGVHAELFSGQARQLAERMARSREREVARREAFARSHERYLPSDVVASLGLQAPPPQCEVTVKEGGSDLGGEGVPPLVHVTEDDLRQIATEARGAFAPTEARAGGGSGAGSGTVTPTGRHPPAPGGSSPTSATVPQSPVAAAAAAAEALLGVLDAPEGEEHPADVQQADDAEATKGGGVSLGDVGTRHGTRGGGRGGGERDLTLENARLRADLAAHVALLSTMDPLRFGGAGGGGNGGGAVASGGEMSEMRASTTGAMSASTTAPEGPDVVKGKADGGDASERVTEVAAVLRALQLREDESSRLRAECEALSAALAARDAHVRALEEKIESLGGETGSRGGDGGAEDEEVEYT